MYTVDLLKGIGRPPGPQYVPMTIAILAFAGLIIAAVSGLNTFSNIRQQISTNTQILADLESQHNTNNAAEAFIQETGQQRQDLHNRLVEINKVLAHEIQWSPILASVVEHIPEDVGLYSVSLKRESEGVKPEDTQYHYSLVLGLLTSNDPLSIENYMEMLGTLEPLKPKLQQIRVANQAQMVIQDVEYLYVVIECQFDPYKDTSS